MKLERQKNGMAKWNSNHADKPETGRKSNHNLHTIKSTQRTPSSAADTNANLQARLRKATDGHGTNPRHQGRSHQLRAVPRAGGGAGERSQARTGKRHGRKNPGSEGEVEPKTLTIALAGNANVGKSVIFNHLTGLHQHIGNWPGKTVEKAEGTLYFKGYIIDVIDLPGIYSLSTFSLEEMISREYIAFQRPDLVINVVDASVLERNLFFTLQLMELEAPMIIALNQMDVATKKGIEIDYEKLGGILGVPVVPTVAVRGTGIYQLLEKAVEEIKKGASKPARIEYGREIEERIEKLAKLVEESGFKYPARWTAIKLLEGDREIEKQIHKIDNGILKTSKALAKEVENLHGHSCETVVTSERYESARCIASQVQKIKPEAKRALAERIHELTTHRVYGYLIMMGVLLLVFFSIFTFGDYMSTFLGDVLFGLEPAFEAVLGSGVIKDLFWGGIMGGIIGGVTIALPYIVPFYLALYLLEDSGYLSRIAYLMDSLMHVIGLHGKAFIPIILSFGCNVPACLGCRIMETKREQLLAVFVVTLIPCAAVTVVVLGLVGRFVSIEWALALYAVNLAIVLILGRLAFKALPGEPTGLIMEMNEYRIPHLQTVLQQTWFRLKEFIIMAFPLIILSTFVVKLIEIAGFLQPIAAFMTPITVNWLGLRPEMGIPLFFGILRKELTLVMLAALLGSNLAVLTPIQMVVFTLVVMLYIPCIATIAALVKEIGWKKAFFITVFEILFALLVGGIAFRILSLVGMP
jgi:ferrous iron transport protein B